MKFRLITILLVVSIAIPSATFALQHEVTFSQEQLSFVTEEEFTRIQMESCLYTNHPGEPMMPVRTISLIVPADAEFLSLQIIDEEYTYLEGNYNVMPVQQVNGTTGLYEFTQPIPSIYQSSDLYPGKVIEFVRSGRMQGCKLLYFNIYPMQYVPSEGKLRLAQKISFNIAYTMNGSQPVKAVVRSIDSWAKAIETVKKVVDNPTEVMTHFPQTNFSDPTESIKVTAGSRPSDNINQQAYVSVDYLIITTDDLDDDFQDFADWKSQQGISAQIRTISWIRDNYTNGCDDAESIRNFIKEAYENWGVQYVLLGGDYDVVPARLIANSDGLLDIPCDQYYANLDGNWNENGNHLFGEATGLEDIDEADLDPEVLIGRAPVRTSSEVSTFIDKTQSYNERTYATYQDRVLLIGNTIFRDGDGVNYCEEIDDILPGTITADKIYCDGSELTFSETNILNKMGNDVGNGYNMGFYIGHGTHYLLTISSDSDPLLGVVDRADAAAFVNADKCPIMYCVTCFNNAFDYDNFSKKYMMNDGGGCVAFIGSSTGDSPYFSTYDVATELFLQIYDGGSQHLGQALSLAKQTLTGWASHQCLRRTIYMGVNLLGDPELFVYTDTGSGTPTVDCSPNSFIPGDNSVTVTVEDSQQNAIEGAVVCLFKTNEDCKFDTTDSNGEVSLTFHPNTDGEAFLTVRGNDDINPKRDTLDVDNTSTSVITAVDYELIDRDGTYTWGNDDGNWDSGEKVGLKIALHNGSTSTQRNVYMLLDTENQYVTSYRDSCSYPILGPDSTKYQDTGFLLELASNCPDGEVIEFDLEIHSDNGQWDESMSLLVFNCDLHYVGHLIDDDMNGSSSGDADGVIETDETIELTIFIENGGQGEVDSVEVVLASSDTLISIISDSLITIGTLEPGESKSSGIFVFTMEDYLNWPYPVEYEFTAKIYHEYGRMTEREFTIAMEEIPDVSGSDFMPYRDRIDVFWDPIEGAQGYDVYTSATSGGTYTKLNNDLVTGTSYYQDYRDVLSTQSGGTNYFYKVVPVNSTWTYGLLPSTPLTAWTSTDYLLNWPSSLDVDGCSHAGPAVVDVDGGRPEVFAGGASGELVAFHYAGNESWDYSSGDYSFNTTPAIADLDGDSDLEVVLVSSWNTEEDDCKVYVLDAESGTLEWSAEIDGQVIGGSVCVGDPDGNGNLFFTFATFHCNCTTNKNRISLHLFKWNGSGYSQHSGGTDVFAWPENIDGPSGTGLYTYATPVLFNPTVGSDPNRIVICCGNLGYVKCYNMTKDLLWTYGDDSSEDLDESCFSSPSVGDIDDDDDNEIVFQTFDSLNKLAKLYVLAYDGLPYWDDPIEVSSTHFDAPGPAPVLANVDGDDELEIIWATSDSVYIYEYNGTRKSNWPVERDNSYSFASSCSPVVADIDRDGVQEVLIGSVNSKVEAWNVNDGSRVTGFPVSPEGCHEELGELAIGLLDNDSNYDVIAYGIAGDIYTWEMTVSTGTGSIEWGSFNHDVWNTRTYDTDLGDLLKSGIAPSNLMKIPTKFNLNQNYPNPFNASTLLCYELPEASKVKIAIYNVAGQKVSTLIDQSIGAGYHDITWDGKSLSGSLVASGIYIIKMEAEGSVTGERYARCMKSLHLK